MEKELQAVGERKKELTPELLAEAKRIEYPDNVIARLNKDGAERCQEAAL